MPKTKVFSQIWWKTKSGWKNTLMGEKNTNKRQCQELSLSPSLSNSIKILNQHLVSKCSEENQGLGFNTGKALSMLLPISWQEKWIQGENLSVMNEWVSEWVKLHLKVVSALLGVVSDHASSPKLEKWVWKIQVLEIVTVNQSYTWEERSSDVWQSVTFKKNVRGTLQHKKKMTNRINCI
jgi:hypothetical protein